LGAGGRGIMAASGQTRERARGEPGMAESREPRVFRLKCAKCGGIVVCPETIVETGGACADCGQAIVIEAYPPLLKVAEERAAARAAEKQRRDEERRVQREGLRRDRKEVAERQREEKRERREQQARVRLEELQRAEHERAEQGARGRERSSTGTLPAHTRVFTCPNTKCDFKGPVSGKTKFSLVVFLFLLLLCPPPLIVGIIYALVTNGYKYECPGCGLQLAKE